MPGTLFVVATPIGNLEDMSPRAVRILKTVDLIACEDTRQTSKLTNHFGIQTPLTSLYEHNESRKTPELIDYVQSGRRIALVSDAGTPLISDPGWSLVRRCRQLAIPVVPIPGPSAVLAALSSSGLPCGTFLFAGFLSPKTGPRKRELQSISATEATLVFFVAPHRLLPTLRDVEEVLGNRPAHLIREMTKIHETSYFGPLRDIRESAAKEVAKGEYTLVVEGSTGGTAPSVKIDVEAYLAGLLQFRGLSRSQAARRVARDLGLSRRELYSLSKDKQESPKDGATGD